MKRIALVLSLALISSLCFAQAPTKEAPPRYQIVSTSNGAHSVFRLDTVTGAVTYCHIVVVGNDFNSGVTGVRCVPQVK